MKCVLCEAGHVTHSHRVGAEAICGGCKRPGVVVSTNATDFDATIKTENPLEASTYSPFGVTCRACETERLREAFSALPRSGRCPACGKQKQGDPGFAASFCNDACRTAWLRSREAGGGSCGPT